MKPSEQRSSDAYRQYNEAIIARHVWQLFQRLPMLSGFWLRRDLKVAELSVFAWSGYSPSPQLYEEVMQWVVALTEECPEAVQLIRGRAFARAVH